jgi:hypothetical protein
MMQAYLEGGKTDTAALAFFVRELPGQADRRQAGH